jgi:hypothetical protein
MSEVEIQGYDSCRDDLVRLLNKIKDTSEEVTIIIQSGEGCCEITGCICEIDKCFVVLIDSNHVCRRTYILLDCICAIIHPARKCDKDHGYRD